VRTRVGEKLSGWACYDYRTLRVDALREVSVQPVGLGVRVSIPLAPLFAKDANSFFVFRTAGWW